MQGTARNKKRFTDWIWSCLTPDNPELTIYCKIDTVLVTLQVWGKVIVGDNGAVQSQHARVIGYDSDDYYRTLFLYKQISFEEVMSIVSDKLQTLKEVLDFHTPFTAEQVEEYLEKSPDPELAYKFGLQHNLDICREIACQDPLWAYEYAHNVDKKPRDDTRTAACREPQYAYLYAKDVDQQPRDDTREAACKDPFWAYEYAQYVDKKPRDDTRLAACKDPRWACRYAHDVDKQPHDDTCHAACQNLQWAYWYAVDVDRAYHPQTYQAVRKSTHWKRKYQRAFRGQIPDELGK